MNKLLKVPFYGAMSLLRPENGEYVARLSEITGEATLRRMRNRLKTTVAGRST
jgi:hypothetical protein